MGIIKTHNFFLVVAAVFIIVGTVGIGKTIFDSLYSSKSYLYEQQAAEQQGRCTTDADCALVQDRWCKTVLAVGEKEKAAWEEENVRQTEIARRNRQTCKLMLEEYLDIKNFRAVCRQSQCDVEFIRGLAQ